VQSPLIDRAAAVLIAGNAHRVLRGVFRGARISTRDLCLRAALPFASRAAKSAATFQTSGARRFKSS
jgi:hypothetical protein